jgi:PKD repeat protein
MKTLIFWDIFCILLLVCSVQVVSAEGGYVNNSTPAGTVGGDGQSSSSSDVAVDSAESVNMTDTPVNITSMKDRLGDVTTTTSPAVTMAPGRPFNGPHNVPGTVQAEDYDYGNNYFGGTSPIAYADTTSGNEGGAYRQDDVDIETAGGITDVGWIRDGEYLTYAVDAAASGEYTITIRAANPDAAAKIVTVSSWCSQFQSHPTTISVASTGSFDTYTTFTSVGTLNLNRGRNVVTVGFGASRMNLDSITFENNAVQPLQAAFTVNTQSIRAGQSVIGTDASTGYPQVWHWDYGDGSATTGIRNIEHQYNTSGSYTLSLTVTNGTRTSTVSRTITVTPGVLTADFTVTTTPGSTLIRIIDTSVDATTVRYDLGDGVASRNIPANGPALAYYYSIAGTYTITQTATSAAEQTVTRQVNVTVGGVPTTPGVETPYKPHDLPAIVEAEDFDNGGEGVAYHDTTPGNNGGAYRPGEGVDITNISGGGYAVSSLESGEWLNYTITNTGTTTLTPIVDFHVASTRKGGSIQVEVDGIIGNTVSVPDTGSLSEFETVFTSFRIPRAQHIIRLRFMGDSMSLDKIVFFWNGTPTMYADGGAIANFTQDITSGTVPLNVHFTDTSLDEQYITKWHWIFGDGETSEDQHPSHIYLSPGVYTANLSIEKESHYFETISEGQPRLGWLQIWGADSRVKSQMITVTSGAPATSPVANCTVTLVGGREIQISDHSQNATSVRYDLGDGTVADLTGFRYTYKLDGTYTITLTATNTAGSSVKTVQVTVPAAAPPTTPTSLPYNGPHNLPGVLQAEDYNLGGEGVAYHDTTRGNTGGAYRQDDVDIETTAGVSTPDVGWIRNGEWLTYTVNITQSGTYAISARVASPNSGRTMELSVDRGSPMTITIPNTGSFDTYRNATPPTMYADLPPQTPIPGPTGVSFPTPITLTAGTHVLKLTFSGDGQNLDWIEIVPFVMPTPMP